MHEVLFEGSMTTKEDTQSSPASNAESLAIRMRCTGCHKPMYTQECQNCGFLMLADGGVVRALPPERIAYFAQFVADYEHIRAAEGRGSQTEQYYLGLPYRDATGCNSDQWRIRARSFQCLLNRVMPLTRGRTVLDIGAGNCWMSYRLALMAYEPVCVDLLTNDRDGLDAAVHYQRQLQRTIPRFQAEAANLPFENEQFNIAIFNASFHYAESYESLLREALRCLKPDGIVVISDTPWYSREQSGVRMVAERQAKFLARYGTTSHALKSQEFLTDDRLDDLAAQCKVTWETYRPKFGLRWALRPLSARLQRKREPARFRIYVARKHA